MRWYLKLESNSYFLVECCYCTYGVSDNIYPYFL